MAVAGINSVSVLESSYLGENYSPVTRRWDNQERPISRTSFIRKMWRELEGENRFTSGMPNANTESQCSCSSEGSESENVSINTSEIENESPRNYNILGLQNEQEDNNGIQRSPALDVADKQRVRQIFREWRSKNINFQHKNGNSRTQGVCESECKRVRTVRQWIESNAQQAPENGYPSDGLVVNHTGGGARRSIRRLYGRQALIDLLTRFQRERKEEVQSLWENRSVSTFAHRNRIQALLRGRFLLNPRFVQEVKSTSTAASELGLLRQTQTVSDLRKGFLCKSDNYESIHDGPHSDTSSDNGSKYHEENIQEPPLDIVNEIETTNITSDTSETNKVDIETEIETYAVIVEERHEPVLQEPPSDSIETMDQDGSVERNHGPHHIEPPQQTFELESTSQSPPLSPTTILDSQYQSDEEVDTNDPSEANTDSLSWQEESSSESEDLVEPIIEDNGRQWNHLTNVESNEGFDANSIENEDEWYQESHDGWCDNTMEEDTTETWFRTTSFPQPQLVATNTFYDSDDDSGNRLELRQLMSRRRVSNLLQSDFRGRLDAVLRSYMERQDNASESESDDEQSVDESDNVTESIAERTEDAHFSLPAIQTHQDDASQHFVTDWEIVNGLRVDMISLQERMNDMQKTLETCMNMQVELQRSVQQEVSSALNRSATSGNEPKGDCIICCDSNSDSSPNRSSGHVYVCSNCAVKINWSQLKESVRHP